MAAWLLKLDDFNIVEINDILRQVRIKFQTAEQADALIQRTKDSLV